MPLFRWQAYEYEHRRKNPDWYWALGIIALGFFVVAVLFGNFLAAILVILAAVSLALHSAREPELRTFELGERGFRTDDLIYPFPSLESFWVADSGIYEYAPKLFLKSKKILMPHLVIPLEDVRPEDVREFLKTRLKEEEHDESLSHRILERLGF